ncbi:MAG: hypothetical protein AAFV53_25505 [Myxococcota bacterium]
MLCSLLFFSSTVMAAPRMSAAWFGETGLNPGLKIGVEQTLTLIDGDKAGAHVGVGASLGTSLRPGSHWRSLASLEGFLGARVGGLDLEIRAGLGGGRTFLASPTYAIDDDGTLDRVLFAGQWGWMPWATAGFGSGIKRLDDVRWFVRGGPLLQTPAFADDALYLITELGVTKGFW